MARTSAESLGQLAEHALVAVLTEIGIRCDTGPGAGADLLAHVDDHAVAIEVKATAYATPERVRAMTRTSRRRKTTPLLVADHITDAARADLTATGWSWLDRRGHLYLRAPGVMIDRRISPVPRPGASRPARPIAGAVGVAVAYSSLLDPTAPQPVRATARLLGFSPSSISTARSALAAAGLLERDGLPVVPELFWALAEEWRTQRVWLARKPTPRDTHAHARDLAQPGWCLTGTAAALEWGAPVVAADPVPDLYVPGPVMVTIAQRQYGTADSAAGAAASVAVPPASLITQQRMGPHRNGRWPLAHPLAVALDLAQDRARGREILEGWTPPAGFHRVW